MWKELAQRILDGYQLTREEGLALLDSPDSENLQILDAAWTVRRHYFKNEVKANVLSNAKRGLCSEDCHYCGQSQHAQDTSLKFGFISKEEMIAQARQAKITGGRRFCVTMAVRSASWSAVETLAEATKEIKQELGLEVCACMGLMTGETGRAKLKFLKDSGVDAYNHNLNTHEDLYEQICTTHTYQDRLETLRNAQEAGFSTCSGLIIGLGETKEQIVDLALTFRQEKVESIPVNFLIPVEGTPMAERPTLQDLTPWKALRYLCLFRLTNPSAELRASAGREIHLRSLQNLALLPANSLFLDGYLTQDGQGAEKDLAMIADLGMVAVAGH
jgi:biotin synthase